MSSSNNADSPVGPTISVVVPVYACNECLEILCARIKTNLAVLTQRYEIVLVDDRSPDNSWAAILDLQIRYPEIRGIRLSRNFGQHIAITAGLAATRGEYAIVLDCDLQDPPEEIPRLYNKMREGYDLVMARRVTRSHSIFRQLSAKLYFLFLSHLTEEEVEGSFGTFSILSRKVIDSFLKFGEPDRHYSFILHWVGFRIGTIDYEHKARVAGSSAYSLGRLLRHAANGVLFQASVLLRLIVTTGLLVAVLGLSLAAYFVVQYFTHNVAPGWTSIAVLILVSTGVIMTSIGVVGLYIGKIFDQVKGRPLYIIDTIAESTTTW